MAFENGGAPAPHGGPGAVREIGRRAPWLATMGFAAWMLWCTVAFSGAFWLHDITDTLRAENLVSLAMLAMAATGVCLGAFERRLARHLTGAPLTVAGGVVGTLGTLMIVVTRPGLLPSQGVFLVGCAVCGVGMGLLFMCGAPLLSQVPPRRSLTMLLACLLADSLGFLYLRNCSADAATAVFVALPLLSSALYLLRGPDTPARARVLEPLRGAPDRLAVFFASVALCSASLELARAGILVGMPPSESVASTVTARLFLVPFLLAALLFVLLSREDTTAQSYNAVSATLVVLLVVLGAFPSRGAAMASAATALFSCFQLVVWSMLAYIAFQAQSGAARMFGLGGGAVFLGTVVGSLVATACQNAGVGDDVMRGAVVALGVVVLIDVLFVFTARQLGELLLPVDEGLYDEGRPGERADDDRKGRFVRQCEQIAADKGLSPRETEVLVELARGWTAQEIADREKLSVYTIRAHIRSIYAKLEVHSGKELREFVSGR